MVLLCELIDTLWNVNSAIITTVVIMRIRINRYIMECKLGGKYLILCCVCELIDTLWNVNTI